MGRGDNFSVACEGALLGWLLWSAATYLIGDKMLGGKASWGELLRTIGFAQSPWVFAIFCILPLVGNMVRIFLAVWVLVTGVIAIRQALDFDTRKAVITALLGWIAIMIPRAILGL